MLNQIIAEIAQYEKISLDINATSAQRDHAKLMAVALCSYLIRIHNLDIFEIIALVDALHADNQQ